MGDISMFGGGSSKSAPKKAPKKAVKKTAKVAKKAGFSFKAKKAATGGRSLSAKPISYIAEEGSKIGGFGLDSLKGYGAGNVRSSSALLSSPPRACGCSSCSSLCCASFEPPQGVGRLAARLRLQRIAP